MHTSTGKIFNIIRWGEQLNKSEDNADRKGTSDFDNRRSDAFVHTAQP